MAQDLRARVVKFSTEDSATRLGTCLALIPTMNTTPTVVRDLMTADVVTLGRNDKLAAAEDLMRLGRSATYR